MQLNDAVRRAVFARDRGYCQYCGNDLLADFQAWASARVDVLDAGERNGLESMLLCCPACEQMLAACPAGQMSERQAWLWQQIAAEMPAFIGWKTELR